MSNGRQLLTYRDGIFIWLGGYETRHIPKEAGFRWNAERKYWFTNNPDIAIKLKNYADAAAADAINAATQQKRAAIEESSAVKANINVPAPDGKSYMDFQLAGIAYASKRDGTLIADEMGLGKTIQAIGLINYDQSIRRALVICPASLKYNWQRELDKWLVRPLSTGIAFGKDWPERADIVIINYDILEKHVNQLRSVKWDLVVLDEAHYIKNPEAKRTKLVIGDKRWDPDSSSWEIFQPPLSARIRLALTGTPILNRPQEMWSMVEWCLLDKPAYRRFDYFRSRTKFWQRYAGYAKGRYGWTFGGPANLQELQREARQAFMIRRTKNQVLTDLPPKRRQVMEISSEGYESVLKRERQAYEDYQNRVAQAEQEMILAKAAGDMEAYKQAVQRLREAHSVRFEEMSAVRHEVGLATVKASESFLQDTIDSLEKVVIFAHHRDVIDTVVEIAKGVTGEESVVKLVGGMSPEAKQKSVDLFQNDPRVRVFVGSITAAGVGITLTAASHVTFVELDWVPANISQAEDRCHRIGQRESVTIQHLVLEGSLTARMAKVLVEKMTTISEATEVSQMSPYVSEIITPADAENETYAVAKTIRKEQWKEQASALTSRQIDLIHLFLQTLSGQCDYARRIDDCGFNKLDADIGHRLASTSRESFAPGMALLGKLICRKYWRQIVPVHGESAYDEVYGDGAAGALMRKRNPAAPESDFLAELEKSSNW